MKLWILAGLCAVFAWSPEPLSAQNLPSPVVAESLPSDLAPESLPTPTENLSIQINLPATRLDLYSNGRLDRSYRVAIGMPKYPTPIRDYNITHIVWNPWWIPPDSEWAIEAQKTPPGPGNPLGPVKMLMQNGILIHGTNSPSSVGRASSHACLRMKAEDVRELAWRIQNAYSEKRDPELMEKYKKNRRSSYWVTLFAEVPVLVEYRQVEVEGEKVRIHPDRYWRGGLEKELQEALKPHPQVVVNAKLLKTLRKLRKKGSIETNLVELAAWAADDAILSAPVNQPTQSIIREAAAPL